ncbi:MAG: hypothetical protein WCP97_00855 [bacterium]
MQDEKWFGIVEQISKNCSIESRDTEDVVVTEADGHREIIGTLEKIIFTSPMGKMMLTRKTTPVIVRREEHYHKRGGASVTKFIYSPDEKVQKVSFFRWDDKMDNWEEISIRSAFSV